MTAGIKRDCACPVARHVHGTVGAYNADGCRCIECFTVRARYIKRWRFTYGRRLEAGLPVGLVDACGTRRRLQALAAIGWSTTRLAERLGVEQQRVSELRSHDGHVQAILAERVIRLYDELWNIVPSWPGAARCRADAQRRRYAVPLAWDDDEIDDPAAVPHTPSAGGAWDLQPCGTPAAARRHQRHGEPLDAACKAAARESRAVSRRRAA